MKFNLEDYETVDSRIQRFCKEYPDGRLITELVSDPLLQEKPRIWVVKSYAYLTAGDQANNLPKSTGYAFEVDGTGGANQTAALENAETSSLGRCLQNLGMSGSKSTHRASRSEMEKVVRYESTTRDWADEASKLTDVDALRMLWAEAKAAKAPQKTLDTIKELANGHSSSEPEGSE
jgi:hypothetical protein